MAKLVMFSLLIFFSLSSNFVSEAEAGSVAYTNRDTTLEELKFIDNYVSGAIPVLQDGFFIKLASGPVLVKSETLPGANAKPRVKSKYYNTLPRLIPAGFEGIARSNFNLGLASSIRPFQFSKNVQSLPVEASSQPQEYIANPSQPQQYISTQSQSHSQSQQYFSTPVAQRREQFITHHRQSPVEQSQQIYFPQPQNSQPQQFAHENQQPHQYVAEAQQSQQYVPQPQQYHQPEQQFIQEEAPQSIQNQHQQFPQFEHQPQQFLFERQGNSPPQEPLELQQQQQQFIPDQEIGNAFQNQAPQASALVEARSHIQNIDQYSAPDAEQSFQVDNLLKPEDPPQVAAYQTQTFGSERFQSQRLLPNAAVLGLSEFEETLPDTLRNRFYKSANLATILAQESLPVQGEQIVGDWDTNKIAKGKIHALLRGAGLI